MITKKTYNALRILKSSSSVSPMSARQFAHLLWGDNKKYEYLFTGVSYTGNGACTGKKPGSAPAPYSASSQKKTW